MKSVEPQVLEKYGRALAMIGRGEKEAAISPQASLSEIRKRMSACGAAVRDPGRVRIERARAWELWRKARRGMRVGSVGKLAEGFKALDLALTHALYLEAVAEYLDKGGRSRGSYLVPDPSGVKPDTRLGDRWAFALASPDDFVSRNILEIGIDRKGRVRRKWVPVRPLPAPDSWFETVWNDFLKDRIVGKEERE